MRTKQVFSDLHSIAHLWAYGEQDHARNSRYNFYFDGAVIYSYGGHFPIARLTEKDGEKVVLFTSRTNSRTTNKHINIVAGAIPENYKVIYMNEIPRYSDSGIYNRGNLQAYESSLNLLLDGYQRSRKYKDYRLNDVKRELNKLRDYITYFTPEIPETLQKILESEIVTEIDSKLCELREESAKINEEKSKKAISEFRTFKSNSVYIPNNPFSYLRYNPETTEIETSQRIVITFNQADLLYHYLQEIKKGRIEFKKGLKVADRYELLEINENYIIVGCHKIEISEIENVYKEMTKQPV
jgi:hypothetical protein